ncbi:3,4-dihydroxyphenylacetate 2,3-dioxygenase [bacterium HR12]|nr:3,4-dihydroxyphenylacetate 2,3-dioxygenase [bacterium HR12]GIU98743.1 MAG: dioxygenase [Actinomycetota bacterium]
MGEVVGAALVAHVPTIMLPEEVRLELNEGKEITLVPGLRRMKTECIDRLRPDTVVVFDTHWYSTFEHIVTAHERRSGRFTSHELPRGMSQIPYDIPGDPELAKLIAAQADGRDDCWILACDDPYLPIFYGTVNIWTFLGDPETRWISVAINQTCDTEDFLLFGELIGRAIAQSDRRVVLLASGGMTHRFFNFKELRKREAQRAPDNIYAPEYYEADMKVLGMLERGDHAGVIDNMPEYLEAHPEGGFGHYLTMVAALGGRACTAPGERFSEYEASIGTGQVHVWFERPEGGWTA